MVKGVPPSGSGCQPTASAAISVASSRSGIPNAAWQTPIKQRPKSWSLRRWKNFKLQNKRRHKPTKPERLFMVFAEGGGMPTVVHGHYCDAVREAARLSHFIRGVRFHVLASEQVWCAASGIETEGHDAEERHGAEHESPTAEGGDAQPSSQSEQSQ